jgi:hypothetical protein
MNQDWQWHDFQQKTSSDENQNGREWRLLF